MTPPPPGRATPGDALLAAAFSLALAVPVLFGGAGADSPAAPGRLLLGAAVPALFALALLARRALRDGVPLAAAAGYPASRRAAGRDLLRGALCGALLAPAVAPLSLLSALLLERAGAVPAPQDVARSVLAAAASPASLAACAAALVLVAPLGEELLYRALLLRGLRARLPAAAALPLAAAVFAAVHLAPAQTPSLFVVGLVFALLYDRGSLALSFGAHAAFNAANLVFLLSVPPA